MAASMTLCCIQALRPGLQSGELSFSAADNLDPPVSPCEVSRTQHKSGQSIIHCCLRDSELNLHGVVPIAEAADHGT